MKAQFILTLLSAVSVLAAPIRRGEGKGVCKVHVGTQKQVTVVHTLYHTASAAPVSSAAPSTASTFSSFYVSSISSSSVLSVVAVVPAPSSSVAAAPVTESPAPSQSPYIQEEEEVVIESSQVKEAPAPTSAAPVVVSTPTPEPAAPAPTSAAPIAYEAPTTTVAPTTAAAAPASIKAAKQEAAPVVENKAVEAASTGGYSHKGEATFYDPDLGACGTNNSGSEMVAAISQHLFDITTPNNNPNMNPICGRKARCSVKGGKEFIVTIVDRCVGCATGDIDLSPAAFAASGALESEGRVPVEWAII